MINQRYGWFECGCGAQFQDLVEIDPVYNEETGEWDKTYWWDEQKSNDALWAHWYAVHEGK